MYEKKKALYNQTASKAEQLALCQFLRDGHLDSQIRKLKRLYANKAKALCNELEAAFQNRATVSMGESVFLVHLKLKSDMTNVEFRDRLQKKGILVFASPKETKGYAHIALSCCELPIEDFSKAVALIKSVAD